MNWVGGSRNRLVMKNDAKRQREFFEKRKMQQRLKNMGISLASSPQGTSSGSMDLVTLFIVNQIAAKKENKDPPKVAVLGSCKGGSKRNRNDPLVLPMSPCSPSQLSLVESQPQYSVQGTGKRKHVFPQGFKYRQLSPVLESAFSDHSASDYLPPITDPLSPFSSISPASSGQGTFSQQLNLQQRSQTQLPHYCSPPPWNASGLEQSKCFSQPRGMTDGVPWSCGSNPLLQQLETPTAAGVLFGSLDNPGARARRQVTFSLSHPEDREPILDFSLNQSDTEQQMEDDVFRGFSAEVCEREASHFERGKLKIHLKDETPVESSTPQTVPDSQCDGVELSNCNDTNFSCLEHNSSPMNGCDCTPSYSCSRGYLSSDSDDEQECSQPSVQAASSYMYGARYAESQNQNFGLQENQKQRHTHHPEKAIGSNSQQMGSQTAQFQSPQAPAQTQISAPCKCKKTPVETRNAETQTEDNPTADTHDASTQCGFVINSAAQASVCLQPVGVSIQHPATGRQAETAAQPNAHTPSPDGKHTPWSKKISGAGSLSGSRVMNKFTTDDADGKVILPRPINPFPDAVSMTDGRERADERGQRENGRLMKDLSREVREEATSATGVSGLSEEPQTLQEVADILLLFKQMRK